MTDRKKWTERTKEITQTDRQTDRNKGLVQTKQQTKQTLIDVKEIISWEIFLHFRVNPQS